MQQVVAQDTIDTPLLSHPSMQRLEHLFIISLIAQEAKIDNDWPTAAMAAAASSNN